MHASWPEALLPPRPPRQHQMRCQARSGGQRPGAGRVSGHWTTIWTAGCAACLIYNAAPCVGSRETDRPTDATHPRPHAALGRWLHFEPATLPHAANCTPSALQPNRDPCAGSMSSSSVYSVAGHHRSDLCAPPAPDPPCQNERTRKRDGDTSLHIVHHSCGRHAMSKRRERLRSSGMRGALGGASSAPSLLTLDPALNHALRMAAAGEAVAAACGLAPTVRGGGVLGTDARRSPPPTPAFLRATGCARRLSTRARAPAGTARTRRRSPPTFARRRASSSSHPPR